MLEVIFHSLGVPHPEGIDNAFMQLQHACNYIVCRFCR